MILLTGTGGSPVLVNPDEVSAVIDRGGHRSVYLRQGAVTELNVREKLTEIQRLLYTDPEPTHDEPTNDPEHPHVHTYMTGSTFTDKGGGRWEVLDAFSATRQDVAEDRIPYDKLSRIEPDPEPTNDEPTHQFIRGDSVQRASGYREVGVITRINEDGSVNVEWDRSAPWENANPDTLIPSDEAPDITNDALQPTDPYPTKYKIDMRTWVTPLQVFDNLGRLLVTINIDGFVEVNGDLDEASAHFWRSVANYARDTGYLSK
jgi:hypothetical protein